MHRVRRWCTRSVRIVYLESNFYSDQSSCLSPVGSHGLRQPVQCTSAVVSCSEVSAEAQRNCIVGCKKVCRRNASLRFVEDRCMTWGKAEEEVEDEG